MDMELPEAGLHIVAVGSFLILEMDKRRHELAAQTSVTVLNAELDAAVARQVAAGAEIVQPRWEAAVGAGVRLRHPDGVTFSSSEIRSADQVTPVLANHLLPRRQTVDVAGAPSPE